MFFASLLLSLSILVPASGDIHTDERHGFQVEVPKGWTTLEQDNAEGSALVLLPKGSVGGSGVTITALKSASGATSQSLFEKARAAVQAGGDEYEDYEEWEDEIAGHVAPGVRVNYTAPSGVYRIVQSYVVIEGRGFLIQRHAPVKEFKKVARSFEKVADSFALIEISADARAELALEELVGRCGSEVEWAGSWQEAARRAREEDRLVLVVAFLIPGFAINTTPKTTVLMDPDVIELVNERFVPLWYTKGMRGAFVDKYGMGGSTFGQALMAVTPEGDLVIETREATDADVTYPFLQEALRRHPAASGAPTPEGSDGLDRAEALVRRGELHAAAELLEGQSTGRAHRLRARVLRLQRKGAEALDALRAAREAGDEPGHELDLEEAELLMRAGELARARELVNAVVEHAPESEVGIRARFDLGYLELAVGNKVGAREQWRELALEHPDSRWAWLAASGLLSPIFDIDIEFDLEWPDEDRLAAHLTFPRPAYPGLEGTAQATVDAFEWLLAAQSEDGSWHGNTKNQAEMGLGADPFIDAYTALGGSAMLRYEERDGARRSAERALEYVTSSLESREDKPPVVLFMDYMTWSNSMMLGFVVDALEAKLASRAELAKLARTLVEDIEARQQPNGGWSYYKTSDLEGDDAPAQSISFTTAAAVLALARADDAGFRVPKDVLEDGVEALERMRGDDGVYSYFLHAGAEKGARSVGVDGAVGRGPACELALYRAGASSKKRLKKSLEMFLDKSHLYRAEQGKVLMHAGPDGQGCHYLFFDYTHSALAHGEAVSGGKARAQLLEMVLDCRQEDGSFLDTPINGRAYGTAMALIAMDALAADS